jgi:pyruvate/2-oxoglutarate/acetoin dehydrogenase E1 component
MARMTFADAIEQAVAQAMAADDRVIVLGEDVQMLRRNLAVRFGTRRVRNTPISESAFLGAAVAAAMAGLRPIAEVMLVDFVGVALDALLNHAAKLEAFSGGRWHAPLVVRAACGGGYGDSGQHQQCLWGMLAGIPGLAVVVPATPADAAGLMLSAIAHDGPVVYLEHKLLSGYWLDYMGGARRPAVTFDIPAHGAEGEVGEPLRPVPLGQAVVRRDGADLTMISIGVSVHRCLRAAALLASRGIEATVLDLRSAAPIDRAAIIAAANATGHVLVVDEDYLRGGLSGEVAAILAEERVNAAYARVTTETTIPYNTHAEQQTLPSVTRIIDAVQRIHPARGSSQRQAPVP